MEATLYGAPLQDFDRSTTLFAELLRSRRAYGGSTSILQDGDDEPISYTGLLRASSVLGRKMSKFTSPNETVGVLLPTSAPAVVTFFALQATGRVPAMLNFFSGGENLEAACRLADLKTVLTSKRFIEAAHLEHSVPKLESMVQLIYLEDIQRSVTRMDKLFGLLAGLFPGLIQVRAEPKNAAVILFTSGTTGVPKGVALSHRNLLANIAQCREHIPFERDWVFFNALPLFHAFGLTGGVLLPMLNGMKTVLYPSPLDFSRIPKLIHSVDANVLITTDTFARYYARAAKDTSLEGLQYVVLGGEKLHESTRQKFSEKSAAALLQGYGATECGPVIAVNQPSADRPTTVGKLLPGMEARLEPVDGSSTGAKLLVRGPNVMMGYLDPDRPGHIVESTDNWFDTGDLARADDEGFITITGRLKRFARIGAEMVSLNEVEDHARALWPDNNHAAIAIERPGEGEMIVLVTDQKDANRSDYVFWARTHDVHHFAIPHRVFVARRIPFTATGKPDYPAVRKIVEGRLREDVSDQAKTASSDEANSSST